MKKVYISGFDVFHKESYFIYKQQKELLMNNRFIALHPFDKETIMAENFKEEFVSIIVHNNLQMIKECDIIIANLNSYRGAEPDSGTIFEIGYGYALNKKIIGYKEILTSYEEEYINLLNINPYEENDILYDDNNYLMNTYSKNFNIMIEQTVNIIEGDFLTAVEFLKKVEK